MFAGMIHRSSSRLGSSRGDCVYTALQTTIHMWPCVMGSIQRSSRLRNDVIDTVRSMIVDIVRVMMSFFESAACRVLLTVLAYISGSAHLVLFPFPAQHHVQCCFQRPSTRAQSSAISRLSILSLRTRRCRHGWSNGVELSLPSFYPLRRG